MASQEILKDFESIAYRSKEIAVTANREEINQIVGELKDTIRENNLTHLTAQQIGYDRRIFCLNFDGDIRTFINPMIINRSEEVSLSRESCVSLPSEYIIPRSKEIHALYQTPTGKSESNKFLEPASFLFQQCQDLLDGVVLSDYGLEITEEFDKATDEERAEVIELYLQSLKELRDKLEEEIENDDMLKETRDAIDFMDSVVKGETKLTPTNEEEEKPIKLNRATRRFINKQTKKKAKR